MADEGARRPDTAPTPVESPAGPLPQWPATGDDAGSWPVYRADRLPDGVVDAPRTPASASWRTPLLITVGCLAVDLGGGGVILARQQPEAVPAPPVPVSRIQPGPQAGRQWRADNLPPAAGLVRVEVTPSVEADGIVLSSDGLVATSYARVAALGGSDAMVRRVELNVVADGGLPMRAEILGFDASRDVAVLRVPGFTPSSVARVGKPVTEGDRLTLLDDQGDGMAVLGLPVEVSATGQQCWRGGAAMIGRPRGFLFTVDVPTAEPGGAVVADDGSVVGMYHGGDVAARHCAVPIAEVARIVSTVAAGKQTKTIRVGQPGGLGLQLIPPGMGDSADELYPKVSSVEIVGDPADAAGVRPGDLLTKVGGTSLSRDDLTTTGPDGVIRSLEPGRTVTIEWRSNGIDHRAEVEVGIGAQPNG